MQRLAALAVAAAFLIVTSSASARSLADSSLGSSRAELAAQRQFSARVVRQITAPAVRWRIAPRHRTCWSHVPWSAQCDRARRTLILHRRLLAVADARLRQLQSVQVPAWFVAQAMCVHRGEGAWNDSGYFGGGMQFLVSTWNRAAAMSNGKVPYVQSTSDIGAQPPSVQLAAAYLIVEDDGGSWREWPNTSVACGLR